MIEYECLKIFLATALIAVVVILGVEYLNQQIIKDMQTVIDSLRDRIQMKNEIIELLRAKLKEKDVEK